MNKKISKCINDLVFLWIDWMKYNKISINENKSFKERKDACVKQEEIVIKRYMIIEEINNIFEKEFK